MSVKNENHMFGLCQSHTYAEDHISDQKDYKNKINHEIYCSISVTLINVKIKHLDSVSINGKRVA